MWTIRLAILSFLSAAIHQQCVYSHAYCNSTVVKASKLNICNVVNVHFKSDVTVRFERLELRQQHYQLFVNRAISA